MIIDSSGKAVEFYDKLHLYDMAVEGMAPIKESSWTIPGEKIVPPVTSPVGNIGLAIVSFLVTWESIMQFNDMRVQERDYFIIWTDLQGCPIY